MGDALAGQIASWNGAAWSQVGPGLGAGGLVEALAVFNASLIIGGDLLVTGGPSFASLGCVGQWDGAAFSPVGGGGGGLGVNCSYAYDFVVLNAPTRTPSAAAIVLPPSMWRILVLALSVLALAKRCLH